MALRFERGGIDVKCTPNDPAGGAWLATLSKRNSPMEILKIDDISLDEEMMRYVDRKTGYNFRGTTCPKKAGPSEGPPGFRGRVIWPIIVRDEDMHVLDGYCRFTTLKEMGIQRVYAYVGSLSR